MKVSIELPEERAAVNAALARRLQRLLNHEPLCDVDREWRESTEHIFNAWNERALALLKADLNAAMSRLEIP